MEGVVEENDAVRSEEYKRREFNHVSSQKSYPPVMFPSGRTEWPASSANVSLIASGPPSFGPRSTSDAGGLVEELTVRNCGIRIDEGMHSELGCWPHLYKVENRPRIKSPHEENLSRDKGHVVFNAREDLRRMSSDSRDQNLLSRKRFSRDPEEVSAQLMNGYNKIMSNSSLPLGVSGPKIMSAPNFSQLFLKKALKGKSIAGRIQEIHAKTAVADVEQDDEDCQHSSHVLESSGTHSSSDGVSLREWLSPGHSLYNKAERMHLFKKVAELVECAHSQGMILQKLRPSCIILNSSNGVKYSGPVAKYEPENASNHSTNKKRSLEQDMFGCQCSCLKQQKFNDEPNSVKHQFQFMCTCNFRSESANKVSMDAPDLLDFKFNARNGSNSISQSKFLANFQLEEKWYLSPEELNGRGCILSSNIYALGVLFFELLCCFESSQLHSAAMSDLRDRVLPPKILSEFPMEVGFCLRLLHPEVLSRPSIREVLQSELLSIQELYGEDILPSAGEEDVDTELLVDFLTSMKEQKQNHASKLVDEIGFLEKDMKDIDRRYFLRTSSVLPCTKRENSSISEHNMRPEDPVGSGLLYRSLSESNTNNTRLLRDITRLEKTYFSLRSKIQHTETQPESRMDKHLLKTCVTKELCMQQEPTDMVGDFFEGLCKYACYSKFEVCGTLRTGDLFHSANVVCSLGFDRDEDYIATAGVSKKIKIFDFGALLNDSVDIHYPVVEMSNKSKLSCLCWNSYIKNYLASTDYDGAIQMWDGSTGQGFSRFTEHQKRSWSVDFSQVDPTKFASGSDDCTVKLWSINEKSSTSTIWNPANVCCVQFSPNSPNLLAFGSADYKLYCYDLRHTRIPWCTLAGHGKTVSHVRFLNSDTLVSSSTDNTLKLWDLKKTSPTGLSPNACTLTFSGHTNEKNFVGLSVLDGYIACGSETNEVYTYYKSLPMAVTSYKFGSTDPISGHETADDSAQFVSSVCWRRKSNMVVAANSSGNIKLLRMV